MDATLEHLADAELLRLAASFVLGLFFGYLCAAGGSIGYAMLAHFLNNLLVVLCAKLPELRGLPWVRGEAHVPAFPLACAAAVFLAGLYLLHRDQPREEAH